MNVIKSRFARSGLLSVKDLFDLFFSLLNLCLGRISFSITLPGLMGEITAQRAPYACSFLF